MKKASKIVVTDTGSARFGLANLGENLRTESTHGAIFALHDGRECFAACLPFHGGKP